MFLANENFPAPSIRLIRDTGYEVLSIQESYPGIGDKEVMEIAIRYNYVILTFDKDYGEIIFRYKHVNPPGVVFFREKGQSATVAGEVLVNILKAGTISFEHTFTVIEKQNVRQRHYKST